MNTVHTYKHKGSSKECFIKNNNSKWTVLFIHGFASSSEFAKDLYPLNNKYNIVSINMVNKHSSDPVDIESFWDTANYFLKKIKTRKVIILGHSLGGAVISKIGSKRKVKKVIWMSTIHPKMQKMFAIQSLSDYLNEVPSRKGTIAKSIYKLTEKRAEKGKAGRLNKFLKKDSMWGAILKETLVNKEFMEWVNNQYIKLSSKSEYIIGKKDPLIKTKYFINYVKELGRTANVIGHEHNPIKTDPKRVNNFIDEFITSKPRRFKRKVLKGE